MTKNVSPFANHKTYPCPGTHCFPAFRKLIKQLVLDSGVHLQLQTSIKTLIMMVNFGVITTYLSIYIF